VSRPDPWVVAAQHAQAARDDADWRWRFYIGAGLAFLATGELAASLPEMNWWAFGALVLFAPEAVRAGKQYFWPKRHWVGVAMDKKEKT
jgi:hypothetical protein